MKQILKVIPLIILAAMPLLVSAQRHGKMNRDSSMNPQRAERAKMKAERKALMQDMNLSESQKNQLKEIRKSNRDAVQKIRTDSTMNKAQRKAAMQKIHAERKSKVDQLLNEEQRSKMKTWQDAHPPKGKKAKRNLEAPAQKPA